MSFKSISKNALELTDDEKLRLISRLGNSLFGPLYEYEKKNIVIPDVWINEDTGLPFSPKIKKDIMIGELHRKYDALAQKRPKIPERIAFEEAKAAKSHADATNAGNKYKVYCAWTVAYEALKVAEGYPSTRCTCSDHGYKLTDAAMCPYCKANPAQRAKRIKKIYG